MKKLFSLIILISAGAFAQRSASAAIPPVSKAGLYRMAIPPQLRAYSKLGLQDFRIYNAKGKEIPYFIGKEKSAVSGAAAIGMKLVSRKSEKKKSSIILQNPKSSLDNIWLDIANSNIRKTYNISGSDDQQKWFGIINQAVFGTPEAYAKTSVRYAATFPAVNYKYLQVTFNDSLDLPVNVLHAGYHESAANTPQDFLSLIPDKVTTTSLPDEKATLLRVHYNTPFHLDEIELKVTSPAYYHREAQIYTEEKDTFRGKPHVYSDVKSTVELISGKTNRFSIGTENNTDIFIRISDRDNPALMIASVTGYQKPLGIVALLEPGEKYTIKTGVAKDFPDYDLSAFRDTLQASLPEISIVSVQLNQPVGKSTTERPFWQSQWFMWCCIGIGAAMIAYFTAALLKDMRNGSS